ncbi:ABC transporter permease [Acholeplasma sp. OttesenSCG-928-E16]|nr:ABC transporter permease [Acholeplasma sp. OttesenSCG-928-E16]
MVKTYLKIVFRQLKNNISRFLSMFAISILGVAFITGLLATAPNMLDTIDKYFDEYNIQDINIKSKVGFFEQDLEKIRENEYVKEATPIISTDVSLLAYTARIYQLPFGENDVMQLSLVEGNYPKNDNEILVERSGTFLKSKNIGDTITYLNKDYKVVGISANPWYFGNEKETTNIGSGNIDLIIYMKQESPIFYTDILLTIIGAKEKLSFSSEYEKMVKEAKSSLELLDIDSNWFLLDRNTNQGYVKYDENVSTVRSIASVFPFYFILIATLVVLTTMTRMVDEERSQIGILKSLGYSNAKIRFKYIFFALFPTVIGAIVGILAGFQLLPRIIYSVFSSTLFVPKLVMGFYLETSLVATIGMIFSVVLSTLLATNNKLKESAAELLIPKAPKGGKKVFLEKISFIWNRLKFKYKSTFRNVFRYKKHLFMTLIGIGGCTALIFTGFGLKGAVGGISDVQYNDIIKYHINIGIDGTASEQLNNYLDESNGYLYVNQITDYFEHDDEMLLVTTTIIEDNKIENISDFIGLKNRSSNKEIDLKEGLIISEGISKYLDLKIGDEITIDGYPYLIKNIAENYVGNYFYLPKSIFKGEYKDSNILVIKDNKYDPSNDVKSLLTLNEVSSVATTIDSKKMYERVNEQIDLIILVIIVAAGSLAIIVTYNLTNVNIEERIREIATLKVLGYHDIEVGGYIFREVSILTIMGVALGILLGFLLERYIIGLVDGTSMMLSRALPWYTYVFSILITVISTIIVCVILYPKLKKVDMNSSLKIME